MSKRWPDAARRAARTAATVACVRAFYSDGVTVRPLQGGDTRTVSTLFDRLSDRSRRLRFAGPKRRLTDAELEQMARVDGEHHALVAYVDGDADPAGIAWFVRDGRAADIALAVADEYQRRGIGSLLAEALADDARAAGITTLTATVGGESRAATALLARLPARRTSKWIGGGQRNVFLDLSEAHGAGADP